MHEAFDIAEMIVDNYCSFGFDKWIQGRGEGSPAEERRNMAMSHLLDEKYARAKKMLVDNRLFLEAVIEASVNKITIIDKDIKRIEDMLEGNIVWG